MAAPPSILELVARFREHVDDYTSGRYNETQLRRDFLDPFFRELGWDMDNSSGYAESYRDVVHEDRVRIGGALEAPDYAFRIGGQRKLFLEAKKPSVRIKDEVKAAYQLRRYAWNAKLSLSILSNFEEFAVYDARVKPSPSDPASKARVFYCRFDEYPQHWDYIAGIFSREAILKGSFDRFAASTKGKRGTAEVDVDFLAAIEEWRASLARNLALRNPTITAPALNFAVQAILDRIIFLRICEDRGLEDQRRLERATEGKDVYAALLELFRRADERYNSGLFHFSSEKGRSEKGRSGGPDTLTPRLSVDDDLLRKLIRGLYYPESPYEFSVIGADILGQVYEQFLGKVIGLSKGHKATITEKPEIKKAGGVYYTPTYVVEHIVRRVMAPLLDGKSPKQIAGLRVLDPACGSGSFLIVAYQYLLDWYHRYYTTHSPQKQAKGKQPALVAVTGGWALSIAERKRILTRHVFGVDVDAQAVEVTKLSLLLKVLEGETAQTVQLALIHERVLPDLGDNIKCGNSLIGTDFHESLDAPEGDEALRINAFDWESEGGFAGVMKEGGFDVVIGNPPYVRIQTLSAPEVAYLTRRYASASTGSCDLYVSFVERAYGLLRRGGRLGFIVPNKFFRTDYGEGLRRLLSDAAAPAEIVDFGHQQVFKGATIYTSILIAARSRRATTLYAESEASATALAGLEYREVPTKELTAAPWTFQPPAERRLLAKLAAGSVRLLELPVSISRGSSTGCDDVFLVSAKGHGLEKGALRDPVFATDFGRYEFRPKGDQKVIFPYAIEDGARLLAEDELRRRWPKTYAHLKAHEAQLRRRKQLKAWYGYSAARSLEKHEGAHLVIPLLADRGLAARLPEDRRGSLCPMAGGGFTITVSPEAGVSPLLVLGLLNSRLLFWCLRARSSVFRGGWITCTKQYVGELPIRRVERGDARGAACQAKIVAAVTKVLTLHEQRRAAPTPHEQVALERRIAKLERTIDEEVYALYGLGEPEVRIVEGDAAG